MIPRPPRSTPFPYTTLFRSHLDDVYTLARYLLRDASDAEDAVQECYLRALKHFDTYRGPAIGEKMFQRAQRSEEHTSELQSHSDLVCRLLLEKKKRTSNGLRGKVKSEHAPLSGCSSSCWSFVLILMSRSILLSLRCREVAARVSSGLLRLAAD